MNYEPTLLIRRIPGAVSFLHSLALQPFLSLTAPIFVLPFDVLVEPPIIS